MDINAISNKTILRILAWVGFAILVALALVHLKRELIWVGTSFFLAVAIEPAVNRMSRYLPGRGRGTAALIVFLAVLAGLAFVGFILVPPIIHQFNELIKSLPNYYKEFLNSDTIIANYLNKIDLNSLAANWQDKYVSSAGNSTLGIFGSIIGGIVGFITIITLTFYMILDGPRWIDIFLRYQPANKREHRRKLAREMYKTVTGYVSGNLLTSVVAAISTMIMLLILGVPYRVSLGVLVGILDLIPLIGATLAAVIVAIMVLIFGGVGKALIVIAFFIIYQQIENHVLQPMVYSKTVAISPLIVAIAALFGAVLGGVIGVLVAIPVAASAQILVRDYLERKYPKSETLKRS